MLKLKKKWLGVKKSRGWKTRRKLPLVDDADKMTPEMLEECCNGKGVDEDE